MKIETKFDLGQKVWFFDNIKSEYNLVCKEIISISLCYLSDVEIFIEYSMKAGCTYTTERSTSRVWATAEEAGEHIAKEAIEKMKKEDES